MSDTDELTSNEFAQQLFLPPALFQDKSEEHEVRGVTVMPPDLSTVFSLFVREMEGHLTPTELLDFYQAFLNHHSAKAMRGEGSGHIKAKVVGMELVPVKHNGKTMGTKVDVNYVSTGKIDENYGKRGEVESIWTEFISINNPGNWHWDLALSNSLAMVCQLAMDDDREVTLHKSRGRTSNKGRPTKHLHSIAYVADAPGIWDEARELLADFGGYQAYFEAPDE